MTEHELIQSARRGESEGISGLLKMHNGIVYLYCKKVGLHLFEYDKELIEQAGMVAIWKAVQTYDGRSKFTTYLGWKLRAEISLQARTRIKSRENLHFCDILGEDQIEIGNIIGCESAAVRDWDEEDWRAKMVDEALSTLDGRERFILMQRARGWRLHQLGNVLGIGKERVRQIETKAIKEIREKYANRPIEPIRVA